MSYSEVALELTLAIIEKGHLEVSSDNISTATAVAEIYTKILQQIEESDKAKRQR